MLRSYKSIVPLLLGCALACGRAATYVDGSVNGVHLDAKDSAAERFTIASGTPGQFQRGSPSASTRLPRSAHGCNKGARPGRTTHTSFSLLWGSRAAPTTYSPAPMTSY